MEMTHVPATEIIPPSVGLAIANKLLVGPNNESVIPEDSSTVVGVGGPRDPKEYRPATVGETGDRSPVPSTSQGSLPMSSGSEEGQFQDAEDISDEIDPLDRESWAPGDDMLGPEQGTWT
jgi:hypothetical protein